MDNLVSWLVLIIGIVLILPLLTLDFLGVAGDWIVAIAVILIAILMLVKKK